jgi:hypothetical protein
MRLIQTRYRGCCHPCGAAIHPGDMAYWAKGKPLRCEACGPSDNAPAGFLGRAAEVDALFAEDDALYDAAREADDVAREMDGSPLRFARPGSALRAATRGNPRNLPCPTCGRPNMLTPRDKRLGYQCDICADAAEGKVSWQGLGDY